MKYHCGLLDEHPHENRAYRYVRRGGWFDPDFPAEVRHELAIWLAMPGFLPSFHMTTLHVGHKVMARIRREWPGYEELKPYVFENWSSATREDCIKLAHMRRTKWTPLPLICQLGLMDEAKRTTQAKAAKTFGLSKRQTERLMARGPRLGQVVLPPEFAMLGGCSPIRINFGRTE